MPQPGSIQAQTAVTIGVFDGLHQGHRLLLDRCRELARELGGQSLVLSFREHPDLLLRGEAPPPIQTVEHRIRGLLAHGIDHLVLVPFSPSLRDMGAEDFAADVLALRLSCKALVLGFDSAICKKREGSVERFAMLGKQHGFTAEQATALLVDGQALSSSAIRTALRAGDIEKANSMLGRSYSLRGRVITGAGRGRELGFPTANIKAPPLCLPAFGVYAAIAELDDQRYKAVLNIGVRPTFEHKNEPLIEVHLIDQQLELVGLELCLHFATRLRPEQKFPSSEALRRQISADVAKAREVLQGFPTP